MDSQARPADLHGFCVPTGTPVFLGELRKRNRRRILLDAASQVVDARIVDHFRTSRRVRQ
jgi:hypothetical protein